MLVQLRTFRIQEARCECCTKGHPAENTVPCDRKVITLCIRKWFGSESAFERLVATDVSIALASGLGDGSFSYLWLLMISAPFHWSQVDQLATRLHAQDMEAAAVTTVINLTYYFLTFPLVGRLGIILACKARRQRQQLWANELLTCAVYLSVFPVVTALFAMQTVLMQVTGQLAGAVISAAINLILLLILFQCSQVSLLSHEGRYTSGP
ncbi:cpr6 [Symbiodinium sp. CCMP2456]|nr:cpr6 [Symbiodinium sp. CCMP2456]